MSDEHDSEIQKLDHLPSKRFEGRVEFQNLVRSTFEIAARDGWREIIISDSTFFDWPLGERAVAESLNEWSHSSRKITILARRYDDLIRRHARFVTWRKTWAHIIECRACPSVEEMSFPSAIWSNAWSLRRLDLERSTGVCGDQPDRRQALKEVLDEHLRISSPSFPSSTLGL